MVLPVGNAICEASRNLYATRNVRGWQPDAEPLGGGGAVMRICMEEGVSTDSERRSGRIRNEIEGRLCMYEILGLREIVTGKHEDLLNRAYPGKVDRQTRTLPYTHCRPQ